MDKDYTIYLISNKPEYFESIRRSIVPEQLVYFDGSNAESFSKLVNTCVSKCSTEKIIIMSDKVMPTAEHINKLVNLINQGHGLVGLYRFGCFGFKKEVFRQVGMMDERFIGGGYEDNDYYVRLKEANISMYMSHEAPYTKRASGWGNVYKNPSATFFKDKWSNKGRKAVVVTRQLEEEKYSYDLGPNTNDTFLTFDKSVILVKKLKKYAVLDIKRDINEL
jgi:GT2 family glycosyltransferase